MSEGCCPEYRDSIELLVDGELSADAAAGLDAHLAVCKGCNDHAANLTALVTELRPSATGGFGLEETRFWRRFEAELAIRVHRGPIPFWKRRIALSFPAALTAFGLVAALAIIAVAKHRQVSALAFQNAQLRVTIRQLNEAQLFPERMLLAQATPSPAPTPEGPEGVMKVFHPALPARMVERRAAPGMEIRLVDDPGQTRDMY